MVWDPASLVCYVPRMIFIVITETHNNSNIVYVCCLPEVVNTGYLRLDNTLTEWDTTFLAPAKIHVAMTTM